MKLVRSTGSPLMPPPAATPPPRPTLPPMRTFRVRCYKDGVLDTKEIHAHQLDVDVSGTLSFLRFQENVDGSFSPFYPRLINRDQWYDCEEILAAEPSRLLQ